MEHNEQGYTVERLAPQNPLTAQKRASEVAKENPAIGVVRPMHPSGSPGGITKLNILTQRAKGENHHETELTIEWGDLTLEEVYCIARNSLIADAMARMVKANEFPAKLKVVAKDHVHKPSPSVEKYTYQPPKLKVPKELEEYLKGLKPDELMVLFGSK